MKKTLSAFFIPALVVVLASCGSGATPSSSAPSSLGPASAKPSASAPASSSGSAARASTAASASGVGASAPAAAAASGPIKIGLIQPMTGIYANQGKDHSDGFQLYLDSIGGTVAGRKIQLIVEDDQGQPDVGLLKAKKLVESDKVQILAGGTVTPECYAVAPYVKQVQVPFINTGNCIGVDLTFNPKYASPYLYRVSVPVTASVDTLADWAYKHGYLKGATLVSDYAAGIQISDAFSSAFIERGGSIVQENYAPQGTADFGPYLAKLDKTAQFVMAFLPGVDGLRMMQQYSDYQDISKLPVLDYAGGITSGPNVAQLKDKALGIVGGGMLYVDTLNTSANQALLKAFQAKYPGRLVDADVDRGYDGAGFIVSAIKQANGNVEDRSPSGPLLTALASNQFEGARGPMKLDKDHDIVQNMYIQQVAKNGNDYGFKILQTYNGVSKDWDRSINQLQKFPLGQLKGKWVGMDKAKLDELLKSY